MVLSSPMVERLCETLGVNTVNSTLHGGFLSSVVVSPRMDAVSTCLQTTDLRALLGYDVVGATREDSRRAFVAQLLDRIPRAFDRLGLSAHSDEPNEEVRQNVA